MKTDLNLPKLLRFKDWTLPTIQVKNRSNGQLIKVQANRDWEVETDPSRRYAYLLVATHAYLEQWHIGHNGILRNLMPAKVDAHSHPSHLRFHPNRRFAYVSCSHGAICQYQVRSGALIPLSPAEVYSNVNPSAVFFNSTGTLACVLTPAVDLGSPSKDRIHIFHVDKNGHLNLAYQGDVTGTTSKICQDVWEGKLSSFTFSGGRLGK
jgi:hypothetical protein